MQELTITRPDDWHCHLRDGAALKLTVPATAHYFGRAIVMPNLTPPVTTVAAAKKYRERVLQHLPEQSSFEPLMTLYLTDLTTADIIKEAKQSGFIHAVKLYPAGATTNSAAGVTDFKKIYPALEAMQTHDLPLLIHGEIVDKEIDIFDREKSFIERELMPIRKHFPMLRIVLEHLTTSDGVEFVQSQNETLAATLTAHHLLLNRNDLLVGGIKPHFYCLPILKARKHQQALIKAAISGNAKFFLGTDSAPHSKTSKESHCGCAGIFTAHAAVGLYAEVFEANGALDKLEAFASFYGADFYGLPRSKDKLKLIKKSWRVPEIYQFGDEILVPFRAGDEVAWTVSSSG